MVVAVTVAGELVALEVVTVAATCVVVAVVSSPPQAYSVAPATQTSSAQRRILDLLWLVLMSILLRSIGARPASRPVRGAGHAVEAVDSMQPASERDPFAFREDTGLPGSTRPSRCTMP